MENGTAAVMENGVFSVWLRVSGARRQPSYMGDFTKFAWFDSTKSVAPHRWGHMAGAECSCRMGAR